jgi:uncharacterized protein GlcG (DUF336 family)
MAGGGRTRPALWLDVAETGRTLPGRIKSHENHRMSIVTMAQADIIMNAVIARGAELNCRPISVIVVEPGCKVKGFKKEDGASMIRFEMAYGKAYAALSLGRSSKLVRERAVERPIFMRYVIAASEDQIFPEGGGMLIRDADGEVIGAVGVTGDTEDRDEELAIHGIHAAGLKTDEDCRGMGRKIGLLPKNLHNPEQSK